MKIIDHATTAVAFAFASAAFNVVAASPSADEARLLAALQKAHPGTHFTRVSRTPIPDLYEAWMGTNMALFSKKNLRYLVFGRVFDTTTMTDLTAPKLAQAERLQAAAEGQNGTQAIPMAQLPLEDAIKTVRGNGARAIVVFSDPACPYCKRLEPELGKLDNVTIHTFPVPFQGAALPAAIWCAADRQAAWHRYMTQDDQSLLDVSPPSTPSCAHPLDRNLALAQRLNIRGTPTILFADGHRIDGYVDAAALEARLASASSPSPNAATDVLKGLP